MNNDSELLTWLNDLDSKGLTLIKAMPSYTLEALGNRIGDIRETHYGRIFEVKAKNDPNNLAYTNAELGLHVDLLFYEYMPGVQFLHCIKQRGVQGGQNQFVDSFTVAKIIEEKYPEAFKVLTQVNVANKDVGNEDGREFNKLYSRPIFQRDSNGQVCSTHFNNQMRDSILRLPLEQIRPLYEAMSVFSKVCYSPENVVERKLETGDCVVFDNRRVMHGRTGYTTSAGFERHLQGIYMDWDEVWSKIRVLNNK